MVHIFLRLGSLASFRTRHVSATRARDGEVGGETERKCALLSDLRVFTSAAKNLPSGPVR